MVPLYHLNKYIGFYCDYFYQATGINYLMHGGYSNGGIICGAFSIRGSYVSASTTSWTFNASLSFKDSIIVIIFIKILIQNIVFEVVILMVDFYVVYI